MRAERAARSLGRVQPGRPLNRARPARRSANAFRFSTATLVVVAAFERRSTSRRRAHRDTPRSGESATNGDVAAAKRNAIETKWEPVAASTSAT